jgi:3-oxoacyl-[acyl-carrier protein] reductase
MISSHSLLITGASSGIGLACFLHSIQHGLYPIAAVRHIEKFKDVASSYGIEDSLYSVVDLDLSDSISVDSLHKKVKSITKKLDSLVLNAGCIKTSSSLMTTSEELDFHMNVNYKAQVLLAQSFVRTFFLKQRRGSIVAVSSSASIDANEGRLAYASSKSALNTAMRVMSKELGRVNIRFNIVAPGLTDTTLMRESTDAEQISFVVEQTSLRKFASPNEISQTILFLCSDNASHITGQVISVDGGLR